MAIFGWRSGCLALMMRHPSVVPRCKVVAISRLVYDARNDALTLCWAYGFVLRHVCKTTGSEHVNIDRLVPLLVEHSIERPSVCRVECANSAVSCYTRISSSPKDVTWT